MGVRIDISIDEIYIEMDSWDKNEMVGYLREDGFLSPETTDINEGIPIRVPMDATYNQEEFLRLTSKLGSLYYRINDGDLEIIRNIVKKY
jgi:hypothetical protein